MNGRTTLHLRAAPQPQKPDRDETRAGVPVPSSSVLPGDAQALSESVPRRVFDTVGAAEYLGVSRQLLEFMRVDGGGPRYAKLGRLVRYRRDALDAWLMERERSHTSEGAVR